MSEDQSLKKNRIHRLFILHGLISIATISVPYLQARYYVFSPYFFPSMALLVALLVTSLCTTWFCLRRIYRGQHRLRWVSIILFSLIPAVFWANVGYRANENFRHRRIPQDLTMRLAKVMGVTLMRTEATFRYQNRLESPHLIMLYDELETPQQDLNKMEAHVVRLEKLLGGIVDQQIFWIRGEALGQEYLSLHGLALGSPFSPELSMRGDRHELAHAVLDWFRLPSSNPPYILHEGWAMSQCGDTTEELIQALDEAKSASPTLTIQELFEPYWYDHASGPVYTFGGAFVDFLLRTEAPVKFRRFYVECTPENVNEKCRELYGRDLPTLEEDFWEDVATIQNMNQN